MGRVIYLGDEVSAEGWRLAGAEVMVCGEQGADAALAAAAQRAALLLIASPVAARIEPGALQRVLAGTDPLALVLPDPLGELPLPALAARLRSLLGMA